MDEIRVTYSSLENAVTLTNAYVTQVDNAKDFGKKAALQLSDETNFNGPVQEECIRLINQVNSSMDTLSENFKKLAKYLSQVTENYKNADINAGKAVGNTNS